MSLGPHAVFIWGAYGAVALGLVSLLGWLIVDGRKLRAALDDLDARGVRRRTSRTDTVADQPVDRS